MKPLFYYVNTPNTWKIHFLFLKFFIMAPPKYFTACIYNPYTNAPVGSVDSPLPRSVVMRIVRLFSYYNAMEVDVVLYEGLFGSPRARFRYTCDYAKEID